MQVCGLQIDAGEVRFSQVDAGEVRPGAAFSARFHPLLVLIQNFCKIDQRNSDGAFAAGNLFHLQTQDWLDFIAQFGSIVLTFLAGMEVDPAYMRRRLGPSLGLGVVSFVGPFAVTSLVAYFLLDWSTRASLIAGTALSTTSLAVVTPCSSSAG